MKANKCTNCGELDMRGVVYCDECGQFMLLTEEVEVVDWEKELNTKTEEK